MTRREMGVDDMRSRILEVLESPEVLKKIQEIIAGM